VAEQHFCHWHDLLNPTPLVADALTKAGLQTILPIVHTEQEAQAALSFGHHFCVLDNTFESIKFVSCAPE
jgi:hypothetical protein